MKKYAFVAAISLFGLAWHTGAIAADTPAKQTASAAAAGSCEDQAVDKNGKKLSGAAKNSFLKKCEADAKAAVAASCEDKAVDKNGKKLAGAAKTSFMKKCEADAKAGK